MYYLVIFYHQNDKKAISSVFVNMHTSLQSKEFGRTPFNPLGWLPNDELDQI